MVRDAINTSKHPLVRENVLSLRLELRCSVHAGCCPCDLRSMGCANGIQSAARGGGRCSPMVSGTPSVKHLTSTRLCGRVWEGNPPSQPHSTKHPYIQCVKYRTPLCTLDKVQKSLKNVQNALEHSIQIGREGILPKPSRIPSQSVSHSGL